MEQAIITLVSATFAVMIYLDRRRGGDLKALEKRIGDLEERFENRFGEVKERFDEVKERFGEVKERFDEVKQDIRRVEKKIEESAARTGARINELTNSVIRLAQSVGRAEGRTEVLAAVE